MLTLTVNGTEYALPVQTQELQMRLDALYDAGRLSELIDPHSKLADVFGEFPTPPKTYWPRPRIGSLYWPVVGLAHYAFGTYLVDEFTMGQIRAGMTSAGSNAITVNFYDDEDPAEVARSVPMYFLASRPLVRTTTDPLTTTDSNTEPMDGWILLLVDGRYAKLHEEGTLTVSTWNNIFTSAALGLTVTDTTDSDYLTPDERWGASHIPGRSLAWLGDIAALSVGARIVTVPGVASAVQRPTAAHLTTLTNAHNTAVLDLRHCGGGPIETADLSYGLPPETKTVFYVPSETTPVVVTVTTAGGWAAGTHVTHWCDAAAATAAPQRSALAAQWDQDWRDWHAGLYDTTYDGFIAAPASGYCWAVEWYHDAGQGYTKFVRPPQWYGYLCAPKLGASSSAGCVDVAGLIGSSNDTGLQRIVDTPCDRLGVKTGCGLLIDAGDNTLRFDAASVAGAGLVKSSTCTLDVNPGCGIVIDADKVALNLTDVVFDGLYWDNSICALGIDFGCGLTLIGPQLAVDFDQVVGTAASTGLKKYGAGPCYNAQVDRTVTRTTTEEVVNDEQYDLDGSTLVITKTKTVYTNHFNAAGMIVDRTAAAPTTTTTYLRLCPAVECCLTTPCVDVDAYGMLALGGTHYRSLVVLTGTTVYFDSVVTGASGSETYAWYLQDPVTGVYSDTPDATTHDFSHVFSTDGYNTVLLVVRDGPCTYVRSIVPVIVTTEPFCSCTVNCPSGAPYGYVFQLTGATGDWERFNGNWMVPYFAEGTTCGYQLDVHDPGDESFVPFGFVITPSEPGVTWEMSLNQNASIVATWTGGPQTTCCDLHARTTESFDPALSGTTPTLFAGHPSALGSCPDCSACETYTADATAMPRTGTTTWSAGGYVLTEVGGGNWTITFGGNTFTATGWDGTGCKNFHFDDSTPEIAVCCGD